MSFVPETTAAEERRGSKPAVPPNLKSMLNSGQLLALHKIENFGWQLAFVRRPLFEEPVAVVCSPDRERHAVLETDGELDMNPEIVLRG